MLERLVEKAYYYFLDGYSGYNHITVDPQDQEKIAFICPFGIFAYKKKCHLDCVMHLSLFTGVC